MSPQHSKSEVLSLSSSRILKEHEVLDHGSKKRQRPNNVPQEQSAPSNSRRSPASSHRSGTGENGENINDHRNKFHHGKGPHGSSGGKGADGHGEPGGTGWNNHNDKEDEDDDCDDGAAKGCVSYDIGHNDPRVHYTGPWISTTTDATTHSTAVEGATVSLRFYGKSCSAIVVLGTVPACISPPTVAYVLDSSPISLTTLPCATTDIPDQPLYSSPGLPTNEEHLLFINVTEITPEAPYALAGFTVTLSPVASGSNSSQPSQNTPLTTPPTVPASASATSMPDHKAIRIVAGVLGPLVFLSIVGVVIFLILRWRKMYARRELSERFCSGTSRNSRSESVCSVFTTTESILRNDPTNWDLTPSHTSFKEAPSEAPLPSECLRPSDLSWPSDVTRPIETWLSAIQLALPSPPKS